MMRRLYLQIYFAILGILVLFGFLTVLLWALLPLSEQTQRLLDGASTLLHAYLPPLEQPAAQQQAALESLTQLLPVHLALYHADGRLAGRTKTTLPAPIFARMQSHWLPRRSGLTVALHLPDGRWTVLQWQQRHRPFGGLFILAVLALAIALGAYPIVRRLTRRLERLQQRVEALGAGDLTARVEVEGRDEVAHLARSFNQAAERIAQLVRAQQSMLASASHELRSPLTRIRMAVELVDGRPELQQRLEQDIAELDTLIGEILLASRLQALERLEVIEEVDVLALLAEECVRVDAEVSGAPVTIAGDPRLLRRLIRNLLENARRYAAGTAITASVVPLAAGGAFLQVIDHGPGIPVCERERIFAPFYRLSGMPEGHSGGVGLGLALVRQIARHHHGEVRCVARPDGGSCFEVALRAALPPVSASGAS